MVEIHNNLVNHLHQNNFYHDNNFKNYHSLPLRKCLVLFAIIFYKELTV